jgi:hypothetical protein
VRRRLLTVSMALAGVLVMAAPASAAIDRPVAIWQMNEAAGATTMLDSSGNGRNGVIGANVQEGTALPGGAPATGSPTSGPTPRPPTPGIW